MDEAAQNKVRTALREAVLSLCSNALDYTMELSVEGLIGVTVDKQDVFLVNVNEIVRSAEYEDLLAEPKSPPAPEEKALRGMSKRSYMKQLVKRRSAMRKAATIAKVKTWKMTEKLKETEKAEMLQELLPEMPTKKSELVTLAMLKGAPPKKRIRETSFSDENTAGVSSPKGQGSEDSAVTKPETSPNRDWIPPGDQNQHENSTDLPLPDPMTSPDKADMIRIMNEVVGYNFMKKKELRRKRGEYNNYSSEVRLRIGQYAADHGIPATLKHFKKEFGRPVSDSTVRSLRRAYVTAMDKNKNEPSNIKELPKKDRGRPLKLKEYDQEVLDYIDNIRKNGGTINVQIVMDAARGVLLHKAKHKLKEFGGKIEITKGWADSFIRRMRHAGYLPESKASRKDAEVTAETTEEAMTAESADQGNNHQAITSEPHSRGAAVTPALSEQSYNSTTEPLPHNTIEYMNLAGYHHGQNHQPLSHQHHESSSASPSMHHHHYHHHHQHLPVSTGTHQRHMQAITTSGLPPPVSSHTSLPPTASHPHAAQHPAHLEPQDSPRLEDQEFISHAQPQISPRFNQSQLSPRDFSQSGNSYLSSSFAHLRPQVDQVQGPGYIGHRCLEHISDAAGYMGTLLHAGRGELVQSREDLEHQNEAGGGNESYSNMTPGGRIDQHGYMAHVLPSVRNHSQQM